MNLPITGFPGAAAVDGVLVKVFTPNGVVGDITDDLPSLQTDTTAQIDVDRHGSAGVGLMPPEMVRSPVLPSPSRRRRGTFSAC